MHTYIYTTYKDRTFISSYGRDATVRIHVYKHMHTYTQLISKSIYDTIPLCYPKHTCTHTHTHVHANIHTYVNKQTNTHTDVCMYTHNNMYAHTCARIHMYNIYIYIYIYIYTYACTCEQVAATPRHPVAPQWSKSSRWREALPRDL